MDNFDEFSNHPESNTKLNYNHDPPDPYGMAGPTNDSETNNSIKNSKLKKESKFN